MLHKREFTAKELQVCLRLASDRDVTEWLNEQRDAYLAMFGQVDTSQLAHLQAHYNAVVAIQNRIIEGVHRAEQQRNQLSRQAGFPPTFP